MIYLLRLNISATSFHYSPIHPTLINVQKKLKYKIVMEKIFKTLNLILN